jgi:hypothetical protein
MQPEPTNVSQNVSHVQTFPDPATASQHGQHRSDDLQDSLQPHSGELWGDTGTPPDATRPDKANNGIVDTVQPDGLKRIASPSPPPRDRITEYENALKISPRKPADGPLFEIIKSNKKPSDKNSPISKLPNGVYNARLTVLNVWTRADIAQRS